VPIANALKDLRLCDFFDIVKGVVDNYSPASPFVSLHNWVRGAENEDEPCDCYGCGCETGSDDMSTCVGCGNSFCRDCCGDCEDCGNNFCDSCSMSCNNCGYRVCFHHDMKCEICKEHYCPDCVKECSACGNLTCLDCLVEITTGARPPQNASEGDVICRHCFDKIQSETEPETDNEARDQFVEEVTGITL
jgi:hypothetical protein